MPSKTYDFEKYSIIDIKNYLDQQNIKTKEVDKGINIEDTGITIKYIVIDIAGRIHAVIYLDRLQQKNYEEQKKLFDKLKRKFGCKTKHEGKIKDIKKIKIRNYKK